MLLCITLCVTGATALVTVDETAADGDVGAVDDFQELPLGMLLFTARGQAKKKARRDERSERARSRCNVHVDVARCMRQIIDVMLCG